MPSDPGRVRPGRRTLMLGATATLTGCSSTQDRATPAGRNAPTAQQPSTPAPVAPCTPPVLSARPTARPDTALTSRFTRYGDTSGQWSGADSTYSVPMPGGSIAWLFSDTFYGPVDARGGRASTTPFLHNSIVVQDPNGAMRTIPSAVGPDGPEGAITSPDPGTFSWLGAGIPAGPHAVQVVTLQMHLTGKGPLDFAWSGTGVATVDLRSGEVTGRAELPRAGGIQWSAWIEPGERYTHIYGVRDQDTKTLHVARCENGRLAHAQAWTYWDGRTWTTHGERAAAIAENVANELSVTAFAGGCLLITQDTSEPYSRRILGATACGPTGPFGEPTLLYEMPEPGALGSYGRAEVYGYNAHEHPELRRGRTLTLSYNVNSLEPRDLLADASIYRPRFVRVTV